MKKILLLALPLIGLFAIPAVSSPGADFAPAARLVAVQAELGMMIDPNVAPAMHIELPTRFTTLDVSADPFRG